MVEPINLNKFRKERAAAAAKAEAAQNRVRHGRTKSEKDLAKAREDKAAKDHSGQKLEDGGRED